MLLITYYAQNYASIICQGLLFDAKSMIAAHCDELIQERSCTLVSRQCLAVLNKHLFFPSSIMTSNMQSILSK